MSQTAAKLLPLFLLAVTACSDGTGDIADDGREAAFERHTGVFLDDYKASLGGAKAREPLDLSGDWFGVLFCPSGPFPLIASIEQSGSALSGRLSIDAAVGDPRRKTPFQVEHHDRAATGEYRAADQTATLEAKPDPDLDPRKARGLHLALLVSPGDSDRALLAASETSAARSRRGCQDGIAARGDAAARLREQVARMATLRQDRRPVVQGECPAVYRDWLGGMSPQGELALDGDAFAKAFGGSYLELDAETLLQAAAVVAGSCAADGDRQRLRNIHKLAGQMRNYRNYQTALHAHWRDGVWAGWLAWYDGERERGVTVDASTAGELRRVPHRFNLHRLPEAAGFDRRVAGLFDQGVDGARDLAFAERLEAAKQDFTKLIGLHEEAGRRGDVDPGMVRMALDYYLADAAEPFAERADDVTAAALMWTWVTRQGTAAACPAASVGVCERVAETFGDRLESLAETLAERQDDAFEAIEDRDENLDQLAAMVDFEQRLQQSHGVLLTHPAFADGVASRRETRRDLQDDLLDELLALTETATTEPALRAIETRYYIGDDLQADDAGDVREAITTRLANTRPFEGLAGGDYFNALYNHDFEALRALDQRYLQGVQPLMRFGAQQAMAMAPLIDAIAGRKQGASAAGVERAVHNLTALYAVLGTYMLEYQDLYASCLKPDAVTVEISERVDRVRRDGFGNVIERRDGWTNRDYYKVNPEFRGYFSALFEAAKGSELATLLDLFANDAQLLRLRNATRTLMRRHACDSPQVKQFEAGLLAYHDEIERRVQGR